MKVIISLIVILILVILVWVFVWFKKEKYNNYDRLTFECKHGMCHRCFGKEPNLDYLRPWYCKKCKDIEVVREYDLYGNIYKSNFM